MKTKAITAQRRKDMRIATMCILVACTLVLAAHFGLVLMKVHQERQYPVPTYSSLNYYGKYSHLFQSLRSRLVIGHFLNSFFGLASYVRPASFLVASNDETADIARFLTMIDTSEAECVLTAERIDEASLESPVGRFVWAWQESVTIQEQYSVNDGLSLRRIPPQVRSKLYRCSAALEALLEIEVKEKDLHDYCRLALGLISGSESKFDTRSLERLRFASRLSENEFICLAADYYLAETLIRRDMKSEGVKAMQHLLSKHQKHNKRFFWRATKHYLDDLARDVK